MSIHTVCVYCGSSNHVDPLYKNAAVALGTALGVRGFRVVFGGGNVGLMGLMANAALNAGAKVTGIIPEHIRVHEVEHKGLSELIVVDTMHVRKAMMAERADAFIIMPGGFGTLDEAFEIMTWKQLGLHTKPIVFYDVEGFWDRAIALIDHLIETKFAQPTCRDLFAVARSMDEVFSSLAVPAGPSMDPEKKWD